MTRRSERRERMIIHYPHPNKLFHGLCEKYLFTWNVTTERIENVTCPECQRKLIIEELNKDAL